MAIAAPDFIYCSNLDCLAQNPGSNHYCHSCGELLVRRYLWVTGRSIPDFIPGSWVNDRYYAVGSRVVLDTQPGDLPLAPEEDIPEAMLPYLRLFSYRPFVPQVYGWLSADSPDLFLLEDAPLYADYLIAPNNGASGDLVRSDLGGSLLPGLLDSWFHGRLNQQLSWLWQIARLWTPLTRRNVGSTLLNLDGLRIDGSWMRCVELLPDDRTLALTDLGHSWLQLSSHAHPSLQPFLEQLTLALQTGKMSAPGDLLQTLEQALHQLGKYQTYHIEISSCTDPGPSRKSNEDDCFPRQDQPLKTVSGVNSLAVVCDGLGGHEGGEIASNLAVNTLVKEIENTLNGSQSVAADQVLRKAFSIANDAISQQNNHEHRHDRRRMGTTLVSLLNVGHQIYLANVGDSRAYAISRGGCRQLTVDDDLASRYTRMGLGIYRHTLDAPGSGALVQALGMVSSQSLVPEIQRFFFTEDTLLLLCSDGVSDRELLDRFWGQELLPVLEDHQNVRDAAQRLVDLANRHNGHDNATVVLARFVIQSQGEPSASELSNVFNLNSSAPTLEADRPTIIPFLQEDQDDYDPHPSPRISGAASNPVPSHGATASEVTDALPSRDKPQAKRVLSNSLIMVWILLIVTMISLILGAWAFSPLFLIPDSSTDSPQPTIPQ